MRISMGFWAMLCVLAWLNLHLCICFGIAAAVHELGHLLVMRLMRVPIDGITVTCAGAQIHTGPMSDPKEALCALAGPMANGILGSVVLYRYPRLAIASFLLAAFNLLPLYPLDGGRILMCVLRLLLLPEAAERAAVWINSIVCCLLMVAACWFCVRWQAGLWPVFAALLLLWRAGNQEKLLQFLRREDKMKKPE